MTRFAAPSITAALLLAVLPSAAQGATIAVTTGADSIANDGACTLREAVLSAKQDQSVGSCPAGSGADVVTIPALTVTLSRQGYEDAGAYGDIDLAGDITVRGAGADATTVDAAGIDRVFHVIAGAHVTLSDMTITGGIAPSGGQPGSTSGPPTAVVQAAPGGGGGGGAGVLNAGVLEVMDVTISHNRAGNGGAGGEAVGGTCGPGICAGRQRGGDARGGNGGGGGLGGGIASTGELTVRRSRIAGNAAGTGGRGGDGAGGAGGTEPNSFFGFPGGDGNGGAGGTGGSGGGVWASGEVTIDATTITGNRSGQGGAGGLGLGGAGGPATSQALGAGWGGTGIGGPGGSGGAGGGLESTGNPGTGVNATAADTTISTNVSGTGGTGGEGRGGDGGDAPTGNKDGPGGAAVGGTGGAGGQGAGLHGSNLDVLRALVHANGTGPGGLGGRGASGQPGNGATGANAAPAGAVLGGPGGAGGDGGGVAADGRLANVTIDGNTTGAGGAGGSGERTEIEPSPNGAGGSGGSGAGALHLDGGHPLVLASDTLSYNVPGLAGAGGTAPDAPNGSAGQPGAGSALANPSGSVSVGDSIVFDETGGSQCAGTIGDAGHNFHAPAEGCPGTATDPKLGRLADNGGATYTRALDPASPAIDGGSEPGPACQGTDQRGVARPAGPRCDSGAYEYVPPGSEPNQGPGGTDPSTPAQPHPPAQPGESGIPTSPGAVFTIGSARTARDGSVVLVLTPAKPGTLSIVATTTTTSAARAAATHGKTKKVVYARAKKTVKKTGRVSITLKPTRAGRKLLRRVHTLKLKLAVTFRPKDRSAASKRTRSVTVRS